MRFPVHRGLSTTAQGGIFSPKLDSQLSPNHLRGVDGGWGVIQLIGAGQIAGNSLNGMVVGV